ncbi:MAG: VOC family protein [Burkholderiales bacterium]|nr:VOC family protein [Anaerolineae bacterium]
MKIAMTSVHVDDPIKAFKFYTEVLGFNERLYMPEHFLAIVASPEDPNGTGLLLEPSDNPIARAYKEGLYSSDIPCIVFGVDDAQKEYERLTARGVVFKQVPTKTDFGTQAVFDDTQGNLIQIHQM